MKKEFINPAVRVINYESSMLCLSNEIDNEGKTGFGNAPVRHGVFGEDSEF